MSVENSAAHPTTGHILDTTPIAAQENAAEQVAPGDQGRVRASLMYVAKEQPQGFAGLVEQFRNNGLGGHLNNWAQGNAQPIGPEDVQQGLGEDLLLTIADGAGVSQEVARTMLSQMMPEVFQKQMAAKG